MSSKQEWEEYGCTIPSSGKWKMNDCSKLIRVSHVTHIKDAIRIIEDDVIRSKLIGDECRLNTSRTSVVWMSANDWYYGYRYGNVGFEFDWAELTNNKKIYWVEAIKYRPTAYRFLLTDRDMSKYNLTLYNAQQDDGPLKESNGTWYWNGNNLTSEFLIETDLKLKDCKRIHFVKHHQRLCNLPPPEKTYCKDRGKCEFYGGGFVLAHILGNGIDSLNHLFLNTADGSNVLNKSAITGIIGIYKNLFDDDVPVNFNGDIKDQQSAQLILLGALSLLRQDKSRSLELTALLNSLDTFKKAFRKIIKKHFNISDLMLTVDNVDYEYRELKGCLYKDP